MELGKLQQQKTSDRFQALEQYLRELSSGTYPSDPMPYVDVLMQNMSDSNFKVIQLSLQCAKLLFDNAPQLLKSACFRVFAEAIQQFRSLRDYVRQAAFELARSLAKMLDEDYVIQLCETNLANKNAAQKQFTLMLLGDLAQNQFFQRLYDRVSKAASKMAQDAAPEVRQEATLLMQACSTLSASGSFYGDDKGGRLAKTTTTLQKQVSAQSDSNLRYTATNISKSTVKGPTKHNPYNSLFPPPENNDSEAQSQTFGILSPETASYYSYKPLYCYKLFSYLNIIVNPIVDIALVKTMKVEQLRQHLDKAMGMIANQGDWIYQMTGIQFFIGVLLFYLSMPANLNVYLAYAVQENLLIQIYDINKTITSRRSVLQREICILLEIVFQRYGKLVTKLGDLLIETGLALLQMKGVYTENQADSLIKSIIVHAGTRSQLNKVVGYLKSSKNALLKAHCVDYMCLFMVVNQFDAKIYFWTLKDDIAALTRKLASDANQRVRATIRGFLACCQMIDGAFANLLLYQNPNLLKMPEAEAGFYSYENFISIAVNDEQFPGYYLQAACCHSDIIPLAYELQRWRYELICADEFVLTYDDLADYQFAEPISASQLGKSYYVENQADYGDNTAGTVSKSTAKTQVQRLEIDDFAGLDYLKQPPKTSRFSEKSSEYLLLYKPLLHNRSAVVDEAPHSTTIKSSKLYTFRDVEDDDEIDDAVNRIMRYNSYKTFEEQQLSSNTVKFTPRQLEIEEYYRPQTTAIHLSEVLQQAKAPKTPNDELSELINKLTIGQTEVLPILNDIGRLISRYTSPVIAKSLIVLLLDFCSAEDVAVQAYTISLLLLVADTLPKAFANLLDFSIPIFVSMFRSTSLDVRKAVNRLLLSLVKSQPCTQLFSTFATIVRYENDVMADAALRFLALSGRKYQDVDTLLQDIDECIADVVKHFGTDAANVRKSAVSCFIDFYFLVGEENFRYFEMLDAFYLRFVIERMKYIGQK